MLKVEYPCREILSSYQNPSKPAVTWAEAKRHLQDVRFRRQNQLAININECQKLRNIHKQIFNRRFDSNVTENPAAIKPIKPTPNEYFLPTNKHPMPRIEYASVIYRQAIPSFEVDKSIEFENETTIVKELTEYLTEPPCAIPNTNKIKNDHLLPPIKTDQQRRLSVSSVSSIDKQANKVHEKWPDYHQISEIVGYRIDPPPSKTITNSISSCPSDTIIQGKRNKPAGFPTTSKQIKNIINLNPSTIRRQSSKNKKSIKTEVTPIIIREPSPPIPKPPIHQEIKSKLPNILCPSSLIYSHRIQTRQWLIKNHFSSNSIRTHPLL